MWIADNWKDYEVIDTSSGEKLERWGDFILVRPDPQVIWNTDKNNVHGLGAGTNSAYVETSAGHEFFMPAGSAAPSVRSMLCSPFSSP